MSKENPEPQEEPQIIYWNYPKFQSDGSVDITQLQKFLTERVPNNHFRKKTPNTWNSGEEFEVKFLDAEKRKTIIFKCALRVMGRKNNHSVECTLCEPKNIIESIKLSRSRKVVRLIQEVR